MSMALTSLSMAAVWARCDEDIMLYAGDFGCLGGLVLFRIQLDGLNVLNIGLKGDESSSHPPAHVH